MRCFVSRKATGQQAGREDANEILFVSLCFLRVFAGNKTPHKKLSNKTTKTKHRTKNFPSRRRNKTPHKKLSVKTTKQNTAQKTQ
jgi:hypothetical protein